MECLWETNIAYTMPAIIFEACHPLLLAMSKLKEHLENT
jgi:hypothetical protein